MHSSHKKLPRAHQSILFVSDSPTNQLQLLPFISLPDWQPSVPARPEARIKLAAFARQVVVAFFAAGTVIFTATQVRPVFLGHPEFRQKLPPVQRTQLQRAQVEVGPDWSEGRLTAASIVGRRRRAAANPRGMQGYAAGR